MYRTIQRNKMKMLVGSNRIKASWSDMKKKERLSMVKYFLPTSYSYIKEWFVLLNKNIGKQTRKRLLAKIYSQKIIIMPEG